MRCNAQEALELRDKLVQMAAKHGVETLRKSVDPHFPEEYLNHQNIKLLEKLAELKLVLWDGEIWKSATSNNTAFIETPLPEFEKPEAYFWIVQSLDFMPEMREQLRLSQEAFPVGMVVVSEKECIDFWIVVGDLNRESVPVFYRFIHSQPRNEFIAPAMSKVIAALEFMKLPFVQQENETEKLPRFIRRGAETGRRPKLPEIATVSIRRPEGKQFSGENQPEQDSKKRHLTYQFLVNAFWRKPNHRMKEQRPIYVRSHLRGPKDAEFKATRPVVYTVNK